MSRPASPRGQRKRLIAIMPESTRVKAAGASAAGWPIAGVALTWEAGTWGAGEQEAEVREVIDTYNASRAAFEEGRSAAA